MKNGCSILVLGTLFGLSAWSLYVLICLLLLSGCAHKIYRGEPEPFLTVQGVLVLNDTDLGFDERAMGEILKSCAKEFGYEQGQRLVRLTIHLVPEPIEIPHFEGGRYTVEGSYRCHHNYARVHLRGRCTDDVGTIVHETLHFLQDAYNGICTGTNGRPHTQDRVWKDGGIEDRVRRRVLPVVCR